MISAICNSPVNLYFFVYALIPVRPNIPVMPGIISKRYCTGESKTPPCAHKHRFGTISLSASTCIWSNAHRGSRDDGFVPEEPWMGHKLFSWL